MFGRGDWGQRDLLRFEQSSWIEWASRVDLAHVPLVANMRNPALLQQLLESKGPTVTVPATFPELSGQQVLVQQKAEGESLTSLLRCSDKAQAESTSLQALGVLAAVIVPLQGFMLLVLSEHHGCHTDPHPGNFRFDTAKRTLWVLDWGCFMHLGRQDRRNMCRLIIELDDLDQGQGGIEAADVGQRMEAIGFKGANLAGVAAALFMCKKRSGVDASSTEDPLACLNGVDVIPETMVPMVRAIGIIGGLLAKVQDGISTSDHPQAFLSGQVMEGMSLAKLWRPFAERGLSVASSA